MLSPELETFTVATTKQDLCSCYCCLLKLWLSQSYWLLTWLSWMNFLCPAMLTLLKKGWQVPKILLLLPQVQLLMSNWPRKFYNNDADTAKGISFAWTPNRFCEVSSKFKICLDTVFWVFLMLTGDLTQKNFVTGIFLPLLTSF